ncbi:hypothetical protein CLOSTMETH_01277 [[Clostridium] methylpentosum DSM 5476]|uniref:Uncharacterized protein n=1 Tax=[Clostridium] methylpentosum DSM 5476 TaxID=537013 RepID=C0EBQ9_9FIRM|nr:hypothetical protein CLOSTMETH_01277 [[Clostridium] methylpentosum DSM 5476]
MRQLTVYRLFSISKAARQIKKQSFGGRLCYAQIPPNPVFTEPRKTDIDEKPRIQLELIGSRGYINCWQFSSARSKRNSFSNNPSKVYCPDCFSIPQAVPSPSVLTALLYLPSENLFCQNWLRLR